MLRLFCWKQTENEDMTHSLVPSRVQPGTISDAFGIGDFSCESALDASRQIQRERHVVGRLIDLRSDRHCKTHATVNLTGGPYNGKDAAVNDGQRNAWVIGDYSYSLRDGVWAWSFDEYA